MANEINVRESAALVPEDKEMEKILNSSTFDNLVLTISIQAGTRAPFGYENLARFFSKNKGRLTPAAHALLLAEAQIAGRVEDAKQEFPDIEIRTKMIISHMQKSHPELVERIKQIVQASFPSK